MQDADSMGPEQQILSCEHEPLGSWYTDCLDLERNRITKPQSNRRLQLGSTLDCGFVAFRHWQVSLRRSVFGNFKRTFAAAFGVFGAGALQVLNFVFLRALHTACSGRMATMGSCVYANYLRVTAKSASYCSVLVGSSLACMAADLYRSTDMASRSTFLFSESVQSFKRFSNSARVRRLKNRKIVVVHENDGLTVPVL